MPKTALKKHIFSPECCDFIASALHSEPCERLESALSQLYGKQVVLVNGHAASLHLALCSLDFKRGDKVLCSVNNFPLTAQAARYFDAEPIFVDCNESDYNISLAALEATLKAQNHKKLRALFLSHHSGNAADYAAVCELCAHYGVRVINDCSNALLMQYAPGAGSSVDGDAGMAGAAGATGADDDAADADAPLFGAVADISCFSFAPACVKPLFSAGFLLFSDEKLAARARLLGNNALEHKGVDLGYFYDILHLGHDYALSDLAAAAALHLLSQAKAATQRRREIAAFYNEALAGCAHVQTPTLQAFSAQTNYIIRVDKNRDSFARELAAAGVICDVNYIPISLLGYYKQKYGLKITDFPGALAAYSQALSLPAHSGMSATECERVAAAVRAIDAKWV